MLKSTECVSAVNGFNADMSQECKPNTKDYFHLDDFR